MTADELIVWTAGRIAVFKRPERIVFAEAIPLTDLGKIDRKAVVRQIQEEGRADGPTIGTEGRADDRTSKQGV